MKYELREANIEDASALTNLSSQLGYESSVEQLAERLAGILSDVNQCVFVSLEGTRIVGWIHGFRSYRIESDSFVEIGGLVVDVSYRGKGIGKDLIERVKRWAASNRNFKLRVRCNVNRKETHEFYRKLGFTETKEQKIFDLAI